MTLPSAVTSQIRQAGCSALAETPCAGRVARFFVRRSASAFVSGRLTKSVSLSADCQTKRASPKKTYSSLEESVSNLPAVVLSERRVSSDQTVSTGAFGSLFPGVIKLSMRSRKGSSTPCTSRTREAAAAATSPTARQGKAVRRRAGAKCRASSRKRSSTPASSSNR